MTRKDYVAIAAAIKSTHQMWFNHDDKRAKEVIDLTAGEVANVMQQDNPRFDRARFLKACGVQS